MAVIRAAQVGDPAGVQRHLRVQRVQALLIHIRGGDAPMTLGETLGDCPAQAAGCTSDKNDGRAHLLSLLLCRVENTDGQSAARFND